jgi:hypothetical protein
VSDNPNGLAAFSSRGPTNDGRIKPEIVAPGTNVISARSHFPSARYPFNYDSNYAYDSGTSMATPMISGMAALTRQWLADYRVTSAPSSALLRALLLNGATDIGPGQYGASGIAEIGPAWPNNAEGWGRASFAATVGLDSDRSVWFAEGAGLRTLDTAEYHLQVAAGQPLHVTLSWTDYPGTPLSAKALVDNLDLEVVLPDGVTTLHGNSAADLPLLCQDINGADTCNTNESVLVEAPVSGVYTLRVRAAVVSPLAGAQPFAITARAAEIEDTALATPTLQPLLTGALASVNLSWNVVAGAEFYLVEQSAEPDMASPLVTRVAGTGVTLVQDAGTSFYRVRACSAGGCGAASSVQQATTTSVASKVFLPFGVRVAQ